MFYEISKREQCGPKYPGKTSWEWNGGRDVAQVSKVWRHPEERQNPRSDIRGLVVGSTHRSKSSNYLWEERRLPCLWRFSVEKRKSLGTVEWGSGWRVPNRLWVDLTVMQHHDLIKLGFQRIILKVRGWIVWQEERMETVKLKLVSVKGTVKACGGGPWANKGPTKSSGNRSQNSWLST